MLGANLPPHLGSLRRHVCKLGSRSESLTCEGHAAAPSAAARSAPSLRQQSPVNQTPSGRLLAIQLPVLNRRKTLVAFQRGREVALTCKSRLRCD